MSEYLFIQSQDPFTETRTGAQYDLAVRLANAGNNVRVLLVQNGVTPARRGARCEAFDALTKAPVSILADSLALTQRQIDTNQLKAGVQTGELELVVDAMLAGHKVIWN